MGVSLTLYAYPKSSWPRTKIVYHPRSDNKRIEMPRWYPFFDQIQKVAKRIPKKVLFGDKEEPSTHDPYGTPLTYAKAGAIVKAFRDAPQSFYLEVAQVNLGEELKTLVKQIARLKKSTPLILYYH